MNSTTIQTIDLNIQGTPGAIAAYLIPHRRGGVLVESGPGSTQAALTAGLAQAGLAPADISDVLLTHIHLDHAGAAGWLARHGARIHVHPLGSTHLLNPEKLLTSAARIYGDRMQALWGDFLPVPPERLSVLTPGEVVTLEGLRFQAVDTPGHAEHHFVYLYEDICFSGDIGGVRLGGHHHLRLPMPPPEFNLEKWRASLETLHKLDFKRIAPTHFGIYEDRAWHLAALKKALDDVEAWMAAILPGDPAVEIINREFLEWSRQCALADGIDLTQTQAYETANPSWMAGHGMQRYWRKNRMPASGANLAPI